MTNATWCTNCWIESQQRVLAIYEYDEDPLCDAHRERQGIAKDDCVLIKHAATSSRELPPARPFTPQKQTVADVDRELEQQIEELRSALINQGWKLNRARSVAQRVVTDRPNATFEERFRGIMSGDFGPELAPVKTKMQHSGPRIKPLPAAENAGQVVKRETEETVATENNHSRVKKEFDVELYKKLVAKGLDQRAIAAEMKISYSTLSTKLTKARAAGKLSKDVRAERPPSNPAANKKESPRKAARAAKPQANGHSNGGAVATLTVSESALDNFWSKLPIEEKARIVQDNLIGALGQ